jgi:hypothetical protein
LFTSNDGGTVWRSDVLPGAEFRLSKPVRTASFPATAKRGAFDPMTGRLLALVPERTGPGAVTIVQNWLKK